jgi:hypothetical protein
VVFVSLHVRAELKLAVFGIVKLHTNDDGSRTESFGDAAFRRKAVQPEVARVYHFDNHPWWHLSERKGIVNTPGPFLDRTDASFDLGDVFVI